MAGESNPTFKSSFIGGTKPKQSSILNFFGGGSVKKSAEQIQPETLLKQESVSPLNCAIEHQPIRAATDESSEEKKAKVTRKINEPVKSEGVSRTPLILNELLATGASGEFETENSAGRYEWLLNMKDLNGIKYGHPEYDPRTIFIPESQWSKFTPFEKQFWEIKSKMFDTVVFFKKGKFFELYVNDADIGSKEFDLKMTDRVNMRMVGVPEASFDFWAAKFVAKGYKVAKVDQLENSVSKGMREKNEKAKAADKIIKRELTSVLTSGTLVDANLIRSDSAVYCMAVKFCSSENLKTTRIGTAFVDASSAKFYLCDFEDDSSLQHFQTLISQIRPREIIFEKNSSSLDASKMAKELLQGASFIYKLPGKEFWDERRTANEIAAREYFSRDRNGIPEALSLSQRDNLASFCAFGGLMSYLRDLKLDYELLSYNNVTNYDVLQNSTCLVMDGSVVNNLNIYSSENEKSDSLYSVIDRCSTPFGRRLLRMWVLHPLLTANAIRERQVAVSKLLENISFMEDCSRILRSFVDIERLSTRIHAGSINIKSFVDVLNSFKKISEIIESYLKHPGLADSPLIMRLFEALPDFIPLLEYFFTAFDHKTAINEGKIEMAIGSCEELDEVRQELVELDATFANYLREQESRLKFKGLKYKDIGKELFQIEVPINVKVPQDYMILSKTKSVHRFWTVELKNLVQKYQECKEKLNMVQESLQSTLCEKFSQHREEWRQCIEFVSNLDCLMSLARFSCAIPEPRCEPVILDFESSSRLEVQNLRHPIIGINRPNQFVSNNLCLNSNESKEKVIILTGANMGGKSTLLRQAGLGIVLAQIGCWVPATSFTLTPFDRIFTRLGANDNIIGGESTFRVELSETSNILKFATERSFIIMDELGRGTSTFDGLSIAEAVVSYVVNIVGCCMLFSTHYNTLCESFIKDDRVGLYYMNCIVDEKKKTVTFLYKLAKGISPKSYGVHVANMAGIPIEVIKKAEQYSDEKLGRIEVRSANHSWKLNKILFNLAQ